MTTFEINPPLPVELEPEPTADLSTTTNFTNLVNLVNGSLDHFNLANGFIGVEKRLNGSAFAAIDTAEALTTANVFTDCPTVGPIVTVTPTTTLNYVIIVFVCVESTVNVEYFYADYAVSGVTTRAASGITAAYHGYDRFHGSPYSHNGSLVRFSVVALAAGTNTITMKYQNTTNGCLFSNRRLIAVPLGA